MLDKRDRVLTVLIHAANQAYAAAGPLWRKSLEGQGAKAAIARAEKFLITTASQQKLLGGSKFKPEQKVGEIIWGPCRPRVLSACRQLGVETVGDLVNCSFRDFRNTRGFGVTSLTKMIAVLKGIGFDWEALGRLS